MIELPPKLKKREIDNAFSVLNNEKYVPLLQKIDEEYLYWDKVKHITSDVDSGHLWYATKIIRSINSKKIRFGKYTFQYHITDKMQELLHQFDMNFRGRILSESIIPQENKEYYRVNTIMEEAIASSQMEGATTTRKIAKEMLRKQTRPINKSQQMIANNFETIRHIVANPKRDINDVSLKEIHSLITHKTLDSISEEGQFRKADNILVMDGISGQIAHTPPPYTEIDNLTQDLYTFFNSNDSKNFIHPIIKGIIVHFILAYIHPFTDGNGRTARSLIYWYLIKEGYWMTEYLSISRIIARSKRQYEKAFIYTEIDDNDLSYFILYNLNVMSKAYLQLKAYLEKKSEEENSIHKFHHLNNLNERQYQILKIISEKPNTILTAKEIETRFGITNRTAHTDLGGLAKMNLLTEIKLNKRKIGYIRAEKFEENTRKKSN